MGFDCLFYSLGYFSDQEATGIDANQKALVTHAIQLLDME